MEPESATQGGVRVSPSAIDTWPWPWLPLPWASVHWLVQCTLECHWNATVDPVYTGIPLGDPVNTCSVRWNITGKTYLKQPHIGMPLENLSWKCPTLGCHWRNSNFCSLHSNTNGGTVPAHTRPAHIVKQSSIHVSLKWQDGGTPTSNWTGICKISLYLEFTALQWISVLLLTHVSTSTLPCACLWYEHHYSFCVFWVASQLKSVKLKQLSPHRLYT